VPRPGDLAHWLSKPDAAARLGISERTLDRLAGPDAPERRERPRPGRRPEPCYNPDDVDRLVAAKAPPPRVMASDALATGEDCRLTPGAERLLAVLEGLVTVQRQMSDRMAQLLAPPAPLALPEPVAPSPPDPLAYRPFRELGALRGLSARKVGNLARAGKLPHLPGKVPRARLCDLDSLDMHPVRVATVEKRGARPSC
jgi:hypothetical protein